ncbi:MAG: bifunctional 3-deoxy-7-phosphoheptulonate synthase/chorismate mutase type II [Weeksellaceae bacterium]|nr:bifunctional 3-deoxy-7-phosphoheptulonate synthase/chorismate mutase type II [Weeksellaceae bacterium]
MIAEKSDDILAQKGLKKPLIIAGPCSAESEQQIMATAAEIPWDEVSIFRAGIWKPRTKPNSFEGVGVIGLKWLQKVQQEFGVQVATEVATAEHVKQALAHGIDVLWIGARTTVNPFQVQEIAEVLQGTDKLIMVKNPVNPDLNLWIGAFERLQQQGINNLMAIHRGFSTYKKEKYRNIPQWQIPLDFRNSMPYIPLICDPSHIAGRRDLVFEISQKAMNFGYDGLMIETHCQPDVAWSDAAQQVTPNSLKQLLHRLRHPHQNDDAPDYLRDIENLRRQIDAKDREILQMIVERMKIASEIGQVKNNHNITIYQPKRWKFIQEHLREIGESQGLSAEFIHRFLSALHQESIQVQNREMTQQSDDADQA